MKIVGYMVHPAAHIWPDMPRDRFLALCKSIEKIGLQQPIIRYRGQILDGRSRLLACDRMGVAPRFAEYGGDDPIGYALSTGERRDCTEEQRKFAAAEASRLYEEAARARMEAGKAGPKTDRSEGPGTAVEKAAQEAGVSATEVKKAKRVADKAPVLKQAVLDGTASLDAAATLADEPEDRQRALVAAGPGAIKAAAKEKRMAKIVRLPVRKTSRGPKTADIYSVLLVISTARAGEVTRALTAMGFAQKRPDGIHDLIMQLKGALKHEAGDRQAGVPG